MNNGKIVIHVILSIEALGNKKTVGAEIFWERSIQKTV